MALALTAGDRDKPSLGDDIKMWLPAANREFGGTRRKASLFASQDHVAFNREENRVTLSVGNKIVYPYQGPCLVGAVVNKVIGGIPTSFYRLALLDDSGGELFVPVEKISGLGIRQLMERSEIPTLLSHLTRAGTAALNGKERATANMKLLTSGSAFDLAQLIESLTALNEIRALLPSDRQALDKARKMLICEISEVTGETKRAAQEEVDRALKVRIADQPRPNSNAV